MYFSRWNIGGTYHSLGQFDRHSSRGAHSAGASGSQQGSHALANMRGDGYAKITDVGTSCNKGNRSTNNLVGVQPPLLPGLACFLRQRFPGHMAALPKRRLGARLLSRAVPGCGAETEASVLGRPYN